MATNKNNRNAEIRTKSGRRVGSFRSLEDAQQYIEDNNLEQVFREPELAGITVTARRPRSFREHLAEGANNFEETFGLTPKDAAGFVPIVGDALDLKDIGTDLYNGNYTNAAIGAGLFLLPNVIEKGGKAIYKGGRNFLRQIAYTTDDMFHPKKTYRAYKEGRYIFTEKARKKKLREIRDRINNEVYPFTETITQNNVNVRNSNIGELEVPEFSTEDAKKYYNGKHPNIEFHSFLEGNLGANNGDFNPANNKIRLRFNESVTGGHRFLPTDRILGTAAHEYGHYWSKLYPKVKSLTVRAGDYFGPNKHHQDVEIFSPIFKNTPNSQKQSPEEVIAEMYKHKWNMQNPNPITTYDMVGDTYIPIMERFNITEKDAKDMIIDMGRLGYKHGGRITLSVNY